MKYIVVTGSVMSSVGKGISSSSVGVILKMHGLNVTAIKIDPYLNRDAGTISPYEHGECFITADGMPVDLDLGSYERFLDVTLTGDHNITSGKVLYDILTKERAGHYLGKTVQLVPHFSDAVMEWIRRVAHQPVTPDGKVPDVCLIEIGGTVGDDELGAMVEAVRQLTASQEPGDVCHIHVSLIVYLESTDEFKTKPMQHGVSRLRGYGINPDFLFMRCQKALSESVQEKLHRFCQVKKQHVISLPDVSNIYAVPQSLEVQDFWESLRTTLRLPTTPTVAYHTSWHQLLDNCYSCMTSPNKIQVGIVGKYVQLKDTYLSLKHAVEHACFSQQVQVQIHYIDSESVGHQAELRFKLTELDAIIVPGGYGKRGIEGMKHALTLARTQRIPCLGICLGMQLQVIELLESDGQVNVTSEEFEQDPFHKCVIQALYNLKHDIASSTRLGMKTVTLHEQSLAAKLYQQKTIEERHRHRYAVDPSYIEQLHKLGLRSSGMGVSDVRRVVEIVELDQSRHPFYMGVQFHPEFCSRPMTPHPLFVGLIQAAVEKSL